MTQNWRGKAVHVRAPGKINVFLKVGAVMDDGYHDVATAYQAVSLYEDVRAYDADDFSVVFTGAIDSRALSTDGSNLAIRAARMLAHRAGYRGGVHLEISKNVPIAGGMGGGSADAAATLLACDTLWGTELGREELLGLAARLGADVPFAFTGGTAIGTGRGDQLSPALAKGQFQWVLALAAFGSSTPEVYKELDRHRDRHAQDIFPAQTQPSVDADVLQALRAGDPHMLAESLHNDLQAPALHLAPRLAEVLEVGEANGALAGIVSGSGPTVAFLAADPDGALELQLALSAARHTVVRATGPVHGARLIGD
ncbi:4-(cytidine 5'-diphospho)-2-C-methyl-D-erythritol kinase [Subtercola boreus]|uniref:4-diphosphocytidyl-2-C-methyl-D-erythritol kinase n=1 Tax=Subtercola boreus TaxID=120213 RepID=A0A3E0W8W7_9MICO|nr:4-(cytidine 5'-diphospho)-2-C-methyl-D-erythritol kinase [Subtercola boreus]RFA19867.1 4-(cytidine 5'-diphospho)-2-C-methyl-D-erythritol kinase [Subtercola boreus]RFA19934.1 4-(cytidine 5'-diphospho)-2-C-methyl-D-erythritol kinase [Subtercola boreus]RFA26327.1 4-(cytidine 5'-diphospho)-2-C-methyl-D-erythritol kinase [Subtercola boreus]